MRKIQATQLPEISRELRAFLTEVGARAYTLYASFDGVSPAVEAEAQQCRHALELAANHVHAFIEALESHRAGNPSGGAADG